MSIACGSTGCLDDMKHPVGMLKGGDGEEEVMMVGVEYLMMSSFLDCFTALLTYLTMQRTKLWE